MNERDQTGVPTPRLSEGTVALLRQVPVLQSLDEHGLHCLDGATELHLEPGEVLLRASEMTDEFWMLLEGQLRLYNEEAERAGQVVYTHEPGASFGEVPLLAGIPSPYSIKAASPSHLLRLSEDQFWKLLTDFPAVRKAVQGNMAVRLAKGQQASFQQEKMAALGTLAAGLMHELNNPGAAARRASTQLRENLMRMHLLTLKFARTPLSPDQKECIYSLQEQALGADHPPPLGPLEQSDAEEALAEWMEHAEIADAWKLAPTLASIGMSSAHLECARQSFPPATFSDAVNWLEALVSSMQLVGTIEESIGRVTELVSAVKSYAYEGRGQRQSLDVNRSILATLIIVGHKLREKEIHIEKDLARDLPLFVTECGGLNQIWTNLLDNAIDAAPQGGRIALKTWAEARDLCILVSDNGSGIPIESQPHIFDAFYTTKPVGIGTGLGLGIVHRIVEQFGGSIRFSSMPGNTEFVVRLPNRATQES